jgi:hemolysin activation/secretion protein
MQRSRASSVYLDAGLALNDSKTTLAGAVLTHDRASVLDLAGAWALNGWMDGTQSVSLGLARGVHALQSMEGQPPSTPGFNPRFRKLVLGLQRSQALPYQFSLAFTASGQYSKDRLLAGERLVFGGSGIGRGFPSATISGDQGFGGSLELSRPLSLGLDPSIGNLQVYLSTDSASVRSNPAANIEATSAHLSSQALGFRFTVLTDAQVDLRMARANQALVSDDPGRRRRLLIEVIKRF